jgi:hypothetical protein
MGEDLLRLCGVGFDELAIVAFLSQVERLSEIRRDGRGKLARIDEMLTKETQHARVFAAAKLFCPQEAQRRVEHRVVGPVDRVPVVSAGQQLAARFQGLAGLSEALFDEPLRIVRHNRIPSLRAWRTSGETRSGVWASSSWLKQTVEITRPHFSSA